VRAPVKVAASTAGGTHLRTNPKDVIKSDPHMWTKPDAEKGSLAFLAPFCRCDEKVPGTLAASERW